MTQEIGVSLLHPLSSFTSTQVLGIAESSVRFFSDKHDCKSIVKALADLRVRQATPSDNAFIGPNNQYIKQLKAALVEAASPVSLSCLLPKIEIVIMPEPRMYEYIKIEDFSGGYIAGQQPTILLNEHLFRSDESFQQLVGVLRNELSHAAVEATHREVYGAYATKSPYDLLRPWRNNDQKKQLERAYKLFKGRITRYKNLESTPHKYLSHEEHGELMGYRRALDSFKPKQLGAAGYNVMQVFLDVDVKSKKVNIHKNIHSKPPSKGKIKQRRQYMATAFFRETEQISPHEMSFGSIYASASDSDRESKLWADRVSDFDQLSTRMQREFGSELCDYLRNFHQSSSHCDYPLSL